MALLSTLNSSFAYNSITIGTACDDGWLPKTFGKEKRKGRPGLDLDLYVYHRHDPHSLRPVHHNHHQYGAAHRSLLCLPELQGIYQSAEALPRCLGKIQVPRPQRPLLFSLLRLAGWLLCVTLWKSCLSMSPILVGINITAIVVLAILGFVRGKKGNVEIHTSIWCGDPEGDAKAAEIMAASMNKK